MQYGLQKIKKGGGGEVIAIQTSAPNQSVMLFSVTYLETNLMLSHTLFSGACNTTLCYLKFTFITEIFTTEQSIFKLEEVLS